MIEEKEFNQAIITALTQNFPKALRGDFEQAERAAAALATAMGGLLAQTFRLNGEVIGRTVMQTMVNKIVTSATAIDGKTGDNIRSAIHDVRQIQ